MFIAAALSALPAILGMNSKEQQLLKLFVFPLMFRCLFTKLFEAKLLPTFKHGDVVGYMLTTFFYGYVVTCEQYSN